MAQDQFYRHEPDPTGTQDKFGNVRYTTGGDVWYDVIDDFQKETSWDILNEWTKGTSWDILNTFTKDTSWDIINQWAVNTSWDILNEWFKQTSWHIHPAIIPYIAQFLVNNIRVAFGIKPIDINFDVHEIETDFNVTGEITTSMSVKSLEGKTNFSVDELQTDFSLKNKLVTNFDIVKKGNYTRTP